MQAAREFYDDLLGDFEFASESDRGAAMAAFLTGPLRYAFQAPLPLFVFESPRRGSGKTLLARAVSIAALGVDPAGKDLPLDDGAEAEKRMLAWVRSAEPVWLFDNVKTSRNRPFGGPKLEAFLTDPSRRITGRLLGASTELERQGPDLMLATINQATLTTDMLRRVVVCRLEPHCEDPSLKPRNTFRHPERYGETAFLGYVRDNAAKARHHALVLLRAGRSRGKYDECIGSSYGTWESHIAPALEVASWADLSEVVDRVRRLNAPEDGSSVEGISQGEFFAALASVFPNSQHFAATEVLNAKAENSCLREYLADANNNRTVGRRLRNMLGQVAGGLKLSHKKTQGRDGYVIITALPHPVASYPPTPANTNGNAVDRHASG